MIELVALLICFVVLLVFVLCYTCVCAKTVMSSSAYRKRLSERAVERFIRDMERAGKLCEPVIVQPQQPFSAPHLAILPDMTVILAVPEPMTPGLTYSAESAPRIPPIFHLQAPLSHTNESLQAVDFPIPSTSRQRTQTLSLPASLASSTASETAATCTDPPARPSSLPPPPPSFLHNGSGPSSQASGTSDATHSPQSTTSLATPPPATHGSSASSGTASHPFRPSSSAMASPGAAKAASQASLPPQGASAPVVSSRDDPAPPNNASKSFSAPVIPVRQPASQPPPHHLRAHAGLNLLKPPMRASASGRSSSPPPAAAPAPGAAPNGSPSTSTPTAAAVGPMPVMAGPNAISAQAPSLAEQIERAIFAATRASTDPAPAGPPPRRNLGVGLGGHSLSSWPPGDLSTIPEGPASEAGSSHALAHTASHSGSEAGSADDPMAVRNAVTLDARPTATAGPAPPWPLPTLTASAGPSTTSTTDAAFVTAQTAATDDDSARLSSAHSSLAVPSAADATPREPGSAAVSNSIEFAPQPELTFGDFGETASLRFMPADAAAGDGSAGIAASSSFAAADTHRESSSSIPLPADSDDMPSSGAAFMPGARAVPALGMLPTAGMLPEMAEPQMTQSSPLPHERAVGIRLPLPASQSPSRYSESMPSSSRDATMPPYTIGPSSSEGPVPGSAQQAQHGSFHVQPLDTEPEANSGPVPSPHITDLSLQGRDSVAAAAAAAAARAARVAEAEALSSSGRLNSLSSQGDLSTVSTAGGGTQRRLRVAAAEPAPAASQDSGPAIQSPPPSQDVDSGPLSGIHQRAAAPPPPAQAPVPVPALPVPAATLSSAAAAAAAAATAAAQFDSLGSESLPSITRRGAVLALGTASYDDSASLPARASSAEVSMEASLLPFGSDGLPAPSGSDPWLTSSPHSAPPETDAAAADPGLPSDGAAPASPAAPTAAPTASAYPADVPSPIGAAAAAVTLSPERIPSQLAGVQRKDHRLGSLSAIPVGPRQTSANSDQGNAPSPAESDPSPPAAAAAAAAPAGVASASDIPAPPKAGGADGPSAVLATAGEPAAPAVAELPVPARPAAVAAAAAVGAAVGTASGACALGTTQQPATTADAPPSQLPGASAAAAVERAAKPRAPPAARPFFSVRGLLRGPPSTAPATPSTTAAAAAAAAAAVPSTAPATGAAPAAPAAVAASAPAAAAGDPAAPSVACAAAQPSAATAAAPAGDPQRARAVGSMPSAGTGARGVSPERWSPERSASPSEASPPPATRRKIYDKVDAPYSNEFINIVPMRQRILEAAAGGPPGISAPDSDRVAPAVTLEFPGLRLTVRTPANAAGEAAADAAAAAGDGAGLLSNIPSTATARSVPEIAPGLFAFGDSTARGAAVISGTQSAATLLPTRPETAPTIASDGRPLGLSPMTPVMMSEPLSRKLNAGKPFTARAFYRSGLPPRASRMHTRRMSASAGVSHSPVSTVRSVRSCAYPRVGPLLHSDSTIPEGSEVPADSAAVEGGTPGASAGGAHYFRAPPSSLLSDSSITSTDTDGQSSSMLTASVQRSTSLVADSSRLRMSDGSHSSSGAVEPLMAVGTDSGDIDSARGRDRRRVGTPTGVGAAAGGAWPWFAVMDGHTPRDGGSDADSDEEETAQTNAAKVLGVQRHVFIAAQDTATAAPEASAALPCGDGGGSGAAAPAAAAAAAAPADAPAPYSTRPHAVPPADAEAVGEAVVSQQPVSSDRDGQIVLVPLESRVSGATNISGGTNISVPAGWPMAQEGLEQVDSCTSALLRAGVLPYDMGQNIRGVFSVGAESGAALLSPSAWPGSESSTTPHRSGLAANPFAMSAERRFRAIEPSSGPNPTAFMEYAAGRDPQKILAELLPGSLESVPGSSGLSLLVGVDPVTRLPVPRSYGGGSSAFSGRMPPPQSVASTAEAHQDMSFMMHAASTAYDVPAPVAAGFTTEGGASPYIPPPPFRTDFPRVHAAPRPPGMDIKEKVALAGATAARAPDDAAQQFAAAQRAGRGYPVWRRPAVGGRPVAEGMQDVSDSSSEDGSARSRHRGADWTGERGDGSAELAAEGLHALPAMVSGVARPTSGSGSTSADEHVPSAGVGSRPTSATETSRMTVSGPVTEDAPVSLQLQVESGVQAAWRSEEGVAEGGEEAPPDGPVASFMLDSLQTDSHSELTMALLPDGGGGSGGRAGSASAAATADSTSGFGSPLKHGSGGAASAALAALAALQAPKRTDSGDTPPAGPSAGPYKLLLQPLPESFSSIPEAWSSHRGSSGGGSAPNSLLNSSLGGAGTSALASTLAQRTVSTSGVNVEVHMSHDTMSTAITSTTGTDPHQTWLQIAKRQVLSPEQVLFTMESDPDLLESFASTDAAAAAAAVREIIPEALSSEPSSHMRRTPSAMTASDRAGITRDTPGSRGVARAGSGSGSGSGRRRGAGGDAFGSALLPGHSGMHSPPDMKKALALPLDKLSSRAISDSDMPVPVGSKRRRSATAGCGGCMSLSAEMAYLSRLRRPERMQRLGGDPAGDLPEGLHWVIATVAPGAVPWLEDLLCGTPRGPPRCGARLWQACGGQGGAARHPPPPPASMVDRSSGSGAASDAAAAASDVAPLPPIEERYHYSYAVAAAGGRAARGGLFAGMLGKCGLQTLSWDTETQGSIGGRGSRMGGRIGIGSLEGLPTFRSTTESSASGNSSGIAGPPPPAAGASGAFALRDVRIQE
eukprot:jgi/Ulvmu1/5538/UM023_0074.1